MQSPSPPPAPNKEFPMILVDGIWQQQTANSQEIPLPPAPRRGYKEIFYEGKWFFVKVK